MAYSPPQEHRPKGSQYHRATDPSTYAIDITSPIHMAVNFYKFLPCTGTKIGLVKVNRWERKLGVNGDLNMKVVAGEQFARED